MRQVIASLQTLLLRRHVYTVTILLSGVLLSAVSTGCSFAKLTSSVQVKSGTISLSRLTPQELSADSRNALGFLPSPNDQSTTKILIDRSGQSLSLIQDGKRMTINGLEGVTNLPAGKYSIMHKQRSPLWYAGDTYFENRDLVTPAPGDASRYLRGALGDFALFLDKDSSIHSSQVWTGEVGGVKAQSEDLQKIYYLVDVGTTVEIR